MKFNNFLKVASVCSFFGAITTILLIYLPNPAAQGFDTEAALHLNKLYVSKLWILFAHPQFNVIATFGIAVLLIKKYPEYVIPGTLAIIVWGFAEMAQQAFMIDAVNLVWRPEYLKEVNEIKKTALHTQLSGVGAISDTMYFLVQYGFGSGTLLMGIVLFKVKKLALWIGLANIFIGVSMLMAFTVNYLGLNLFLHPVNLFFEWIYPVLQPAVRITLGIWLWQQIKVNNIDSSSNAELSAQKTGV